MRHGKKFNHLGRKAAHRKALLKNMSCALIEHKRIKTTLAKAKALRRYLEPLVTKAKNNTVHNQRVVFSYLQDKEAIKELFGDVAAKIGDRPGGYFRIIKLEFRKSDGAEMALIEFVDYNETYTAPKSGDSDNGKRKRRRTRRSGGNSAAVKDETVAEELEEELEEMEVALEDDLEEEIEPTENEATDEEDNKEK